MAKQKTDIATYIITDQAGLELGEGAGATEPEALLSLYSLAMEDKAFAKRVSGVSLAFNGKALYFTGKGPFPPNVGEVGFERVA